MISKKRKQPIKKIGNRGVLQEMYDDLVALEEKRQKTEKNWKDKTEKQKSALLEAISSLEDKTKKTENNPDFKE